MIALRTPLESVRLAQLRCAQALCLAWAIVFAVWWWMPGILLAILAARFVEHLYPDLIGLQAYPPVGRLP